MGEHRVGEETERGEHERHRIEFDGRETSGIGQGAVDDTRENVDEKSHADHDERAIYRNQVVLVHRLEMNERREHAEVEEEIGEYDERKAEVIACHV